MNLTSNVFDKTVKEEKSILDNKNYSKPWDKEAYTKTQRKIVEEKRKAKQWKPGY